MDNLTVVNWHEAAHGANAAVTLTTVPYTFPRISDVEDAGSVTVQDSANGVFAVDGHIVARIRERHSAHADRRLHVGSGGDVVRQAAGSAGPSVNLPTLTVYAMSVVVVDVVVVSVRRRRRRMNNRISVVCSAGLVSRRKRADHHPVRDSKKKEGG